MVELRRRRYRIEWTSEGNQKQQNHSGFRKMAGYVPCQEQWKSPKRDPTNAENGSVRVCAPEIQLLREQKRRMGCTQERMAVQTIRERSVEPLHGVGLQGHQAGWHHRNKFFAPVPAISKFDFAGTGVFRFSRRRSRYDSQAPLLANRRLIPQLQKTAWDTLPDTSILRPYIIL